MSVDPAGFPSDTSKPKVYPTFFIGLGGTGYQVVRRAKREMLRHGYDLPLFQYLVLDTAGLSEEPGLDEREHLIDGVQYLYVGGYNPNQIINNLDSWPYIKRWWKRTDTEKLQSLVTVDQGAGQMRAVGRMAFFRNFHDIRAHLDFMINQATSQDTYEAAKKDFDVQIPLTPKIYIVFSLCGGTGSSLFLDVAYVMRELLQKTKALQVIGVAVLPGPYMQEITSSLQREHIQANSYAALQELERLHTLALGRQSDQQGNILWDVRYANDLRVALPDLPFDYIYLIDDKTEGGKSYDLPAIYETLGQSLFWLSAPSMSSLFWERAVNLKNITNFAGGTTDASGRRRGTRYSSLGVGLCAIDWQTEAAQRQRALLSYLLPAIISSPNTTLDLNYIPSTASELLRQVLAPENPDSFPAPPQDASSAVFRSQEELANWLDMQKIQYDDDARLNDSKWLLLKTRYKDALTKHLMSDLQTSLLTYGLGAANQAAQIMLATLRNLSQLCSAEEREQTRKSEEAQQQYALIVAGARQRDKMGQLLLRIVSRAAGVRIRQKSENGALLSIAQRGAQYYYEQQHASFRARAARELRDEMMRGLVERLEREVRTFIARAIEDLQKWDGDVKRLVQEESEKHNRVSQHQGLDPIILIPSAQQGSFENALRQGHINIRGIAQTALQAAFKNWKVLGSSFQSTQDENNRIIDDQKQKILEVITAEINRAGSNERVLARLAADNKEARWYRERFLSRHECLWNFEEDVSSEIQSLVETIRLLGVDKNTADPSVKSGSDELSILRNHLNKDVNNGLNIISTGLPSEIVFLSTKHGLPIMWVRGMQSLHMAYKKLERKAPYLHIDYREEVLKEYFDLVDIRWTPQKILFELEQIQGSQALRTDIKRAADSYKDQLMKAGLKLDELIQVTSEQDPLLLLFDTLEQARTTHKASSNISDVEEEIQILREFLLTLKWEKQEGQWKQIK